MILLDTNVLIYAYHPDSPFYPWARETIIDAVTGDGAVINAVILAEICVGDSEPATAAGRISSWGIEILDIPAAAAVICAKAYSRYRMRRLSDTDLEVPAMPLPDFFIGAHAKVMGWEIATGGAFSGAGNTVPPMIVSIPLTLFRIPLAWVLAYPLGIGIDGIWWSISATTILKALILVFWFSRGHWARKKV